MKKLLLLLLAATTSLCATPRAVVFDWGKVLSKNTPVLEEFLCDTLHLSHAEFEAANRERKQTSTADSSSLDFWQALAHEKGIALRPDWSETYISVLKASVGVNPHMHRLVEELKDKQIRVGLLSNVEHRHKDVLREFGFYDPFDPCLLSCEVGLKKPDPRIYALLVQKLGLRAEEIVFIDDKRVNVEAAKQMGIDAIVFESPEQVRAELTARGL